MLAIFQALTLSPFLYAADGDAAKSGKPSPQTTNARLPNLPAPAAASSAGTDDEEWKITLGVGVAYAPRYEGAANNRLRMLPLIEASYNQGEIFISLLRGIGINFSEEKNLQYGVKMALGKARNPFEDPHLNGMSDIPYVPEGGLFFSERLGPISFSANVLSGINGVHADAGVGSGLPLTEQDMLRIGVNYFWGDTLYHQTYFGVTATEAAASNGVLTAYNASEGLKDMTWNLAWVHNFDSSTFSNVSWSYKKLQGSAALSPLTERTALNSLIFSAGIRF